MIISGGENIYPAEVERLIADIDGVTGVAVIGVPDLRWGEVPVAVLTVRAGVHPDAAAIARLLEGRVARYKIPKRVEVLPELPRTALGKVRKAELRARFGREPLAQPLTSEPGRPLPAASTGF
jgi:fatty-acyl-CoA synthase